MEATRRIPPEEWESHKEDIYALYVKENMTLKDVIEEMANSHGFRATKAQYVRKLNQWHMEKNSTNKMWKFAASQVEKRKLEGKETEILINGKPVPSKKLKKEMARHAGVKSATLNEQGKFCFLTVMMEPVLTSSAAAETGVSTRIGVRTPVAEAIGSVEYMKIPWFQFQERLEACIGRAMTGTVPVDIERSVQDFLSPMSSDAASRVLGSSSPLTTLLSTTWDLTLPNDAAQDSVPSVFGDEPAFDWGTILYTQQPPSIPPDEESNREVRKLLGQCLNLAIDPDSPKYISEVSSELENVTIQSHGGEVTRHVQQLYDCSVSNPAFQLLRYAVYLSSNGLLSDDKTDRLLNWVIKSKKLWVLERLIDTKGTTIEIFASNILVSAAKLDHIGAVRALLAKGADPNSFGGSPSRRLALHEAVKNGNMQIVQHLVDAGANPNARQYASFGRTALEIAISGTDVALVKMLISRGAEVNAARKYGTLLHLAVRLGDSDIVGALLRAGARVNDAVPGWGTALQQAARLGHVEIVEALLEAGADVDSPIGEAYKDVAEESAAKRLYSFFLTPLQLAATRDETETVQILLDAGAGVNEFPAAKYFKSLRFNGSHDGCESYTSDFYDYDDEVDVMELGSAKFNSSHFFAEHHSQQLVTALQAAVLNNNIVLVRLLLSLGAEVDAIGANGTALQIAASNPSRFKMVQLLLSKGANVNSPVQVPAARTALQAAAKSGDMRTVELLLRMGADINAPPCSQAGCTAVQAAAQSGNLELVKLLVGAGADVHADAAIVSGRTCLQSAAAEGHINIVDYLLQLGVNINEPACPRKGYTALQVAIDYRHMSVAERLLEKGADANGLPSREEGLAALETAIVGGWYDFAQLLLDKGANPNGFLSSSTPLGIAIEDGALSMARRLIDAGTDVNRCFSSFGDKIMPLQAAVLHGRIDMVRLLLGAGAKIDGMHGTTPLLEAISRDRFDIAQLLLLKGVSPNPCRHYEGASALQRVTCRFPINEDMLRILVDSGARVDVDHGIPLRNAAANGSLKAVEILLQAGAEVNAPAWEPHSKTALQGAVESGKLDIVVALLNRGADINAPPSAEWGATALQVAAGCGNVRMVQFLLAHGADVNGPPSRCNGATALQMAVIRGQLRIVLMLLKSGADVNAAGAAEGGRTAIEAAAEHGRLDIMHLLLRNNDNVENMEARCKRAAKLASSNGHLVLAKVLREWKRNT